MSIIFKANQSYDLFQKVALNLRLLIVWISAVFVMGDEFMPYISAFMTASIQGF